MPWTQTFVNLLDAFGFPKQILGYTDSTNYALAHNVLDTSGNAINPAVATGAVHLTGSPTVTVGTYTTGMVVGGLITLTGATRNNAGSGTLQTAGVTVKTTINAFYEVIFFDTNPTHSTFTDNQTLNINTADMPYICARAQCSTLVNCGTPRLLLATNMAQPFKLSASSTNLYAVIVARGTAAYVSTDAVGLSALIIQD